MGKENLMQKINTLLQEEEINYAEAAAALGKKALSPLKKIIESNNPLAANAIELEKIINLYLAEKKPAAIKGGQFSIRMRSIASIAPDKQIKGFGSDMKPRRGRL